MTEEELFPPAIDGFLTVVTRSCKGTGLLGPASIRYRISYIQELSQKVAARIKTHV